MPDTNLSVLFERKIQGAFISLFRDISDLYAPRWHLGAVKNNAQHYVICSMNLYMKNKRSFYISPTYYKGERLFCVSISELGATDTVSPANIVILDFHDALCIVKSLLLYFYLFFSDAYIKPVNYGCVMQRLDQFYFSLASAIKSVQNLSGAAYLLVGQYKSGTDFSCGAENAVPICK